VLDGIPARTTVEEEVRLLHAEKQVVADALFPMPSRPSMRMVRLKRAYDAPSRSDGRRILVVRLWPRGPSEEAARWVCDSLRPCDTADQPCHLASLSRNHPFGVKAPYAAPLPSVFPANCHPGPRLADGGAP
jgi:hypothetical protein